MLKILEEIARDPDTPASARVTAVRTLREFPEPPAEVDRFAELDRDVPLLRTRRTHRNN